MKQVQKRDNGYAFHPHDTFGQQKPLKFRETSEDIQWDKLGVFLLVFLLSGCVFWTAYSFIRVVINWLSP